ncbi:MAG: LuxR family transcriptional regulator [Leptolyngbya sp. SIO1D8]|nr:LuxR family transcriptional regulator [Leptolyngbya sp. SIO1D8]
MENSTKTPLQGLFQDIAQAQNETELKQSILAKAGEYFAAKRWAIYFLDQLPTMDDNMPEIVKRAISLDYNPVLRYLVQRHAAIHEEMILPPGVWQTICPRADHGHVMAGPIIRQGQLVGGIAFTRHRDSPAFTADNLTDLNAVCLHFSARLATLRSQVVALDMDSEEPRLRTGHRLTPRESQIADLVAQGLTNRKIGTALWITENSVKQALKRMFRKLGVSSRAEMVAKLSMDTPISSSKTAV